MATLIAFFEKGEGRQSTITCPTNYTLVITWSRVLKRKVWWKAEAIAWICSVKKTFLKFSQYRQENICAGVMFNYDAVSSLQFYQKGDSHTVVLQYILQRHILFKYTFEWLLLIEGWILLKMALIAILMFLTLVNKWSSYFPLTCNLTANPWKFPKIYFFTNVKNSFFKLIAFLLFSIAAWC